MCQVYLTEEVHVYRYICAFWSKQFFISYVYSVDNFTFNVLSLLSNILSFPQQRKQYLTIDLHSAIFKGYGLDISSSALINSISDTVTRKFFYSFGKSLFTEAFARCDWRTDGILLEGISSNSHISTGRQTAKGPMSPI